MNRQARLLILLTALLPLAINVSPSLGAPAGVPDTVVVGVAQEPDAFLFSAMQVSGEIQDVLFAQMVRYNDRGLVAEDLPVIPLYFRLYLTTSKRALRNVRPGGFSGITWNAPEWGWAQ